MSTPPAPTKKQRRLADARRRKIAAQEETERRDDEAAEVIAPRAQRANKIRITMQDANGKTVTGMLSVSRLAAERTALGNMRVERNNVVRNLHRRQGKRVDAGLKPMITEEHVKASDKLIGDWDDGGGTAGLGNSDYLNRSAGRTAPGSGVSDVKHKAVLAQVHARGRVEAALAYLGGLGDIVAACVIIGVDLTAWADMRGWDRKQTVGYLAAALDRLHEFYSGGRRVGSVFGDSPALTAVPIPGGKGDRR